MTENKADEDREGTSGLENMDKIFVICIMAGGLIGAMVHAIFPNYEWIVYFFLSAGMVVGLLICLEISSKEIMRLRKELYICKIGKEAVGKMWERDD